jgi:hypothetical protein
MRALVWTIVAVAVGCAAGPPAVGAATLPVQQASGLLFVELRDAHDAPLLALLDTGANASAIDPKRSSQLPAVDTVEIVGTTGTVKAERVDIEGLHFGALALPRLRATRRDLGGLLAPKDRRVDMILGTDACTGRVLVLDFAAGTAALQPHPSPGLRSVPMRLDQGIPALPARLGGFDLELRVDTGASLFATDDVYVNLPPHAWRAIVGTGAAAPVAQLQGTGADGRSVPLPVYRVPAACIAGVDCARTFAIVQPEAGYFASPDALGFVSNNFLARLGRVEFDFAAQRFACSQ